MRTGQFSRTIKLLFWFYTIAFAGLAAASADILDDYNVIFNSQSSNPSESMPVGGGDVGLNVWVEDNELLFYIGRGGTFDENNQMLKLGRIRLKMEPNPFTEKGRFRQELKLREGCVEIEATNPGAVSATIKIWAEVFDPVIHVDIESNEPVKVEAQYEGWRNAARELPADCRKSRFPCMSLVGYPGKVTMYPDHVTHRDDAVIWYHRNNNDDLVFDKEIKQQELEEVKDRVVNPLKDRTFGGLMKGDNMVGAGTAEGRYADTDFKAWKLRSKSPGTRHKLNIYLHTDQAETIDKWQSDLDELVRNAETLQKSAWKLHQEWWRQFWDRSHVFINPDKPDPNDKAWQVGRNYQLFRYMLGCNAYGKWPTKFNGSFFTWDPGFVKNKRGVKTESPDFRTWGGGSFTAQNQRLVYWPMLKNGDFDMMPSQFDFYRRALNAAELRTKVYWGHDGCSFTEQLENFGLPVGSCYGWLNALCEWGERKVGTPKGVQSIGVTYQFGHQLDFSFMILEYYRYSHKDISAYLPFIDSAVTFFDEHYRYRQKERTGKPLDGNGHLVIYPSRACETYVDANNPADVIAGLKAVLSRLLELPDKYVSAARKEKYREMLGRVPPLPIKEKDGKRYLAGAESWGKFAVGEIPELYSVFPYNIFGVGRDELELARYTWTDCLRERQKKMKEPWYQGGIFAARLGLAEDAGAVAVFKLSDSGLRFPAFRDTDDWTPDHNWLGAGMTGLQEMLMQTPDRKIYLLPAWPREWDVDFKLHAPYQTVVEGAVRGGKIETLKVTPEERRRDVIIVEPK
ncbi:MAG TPA: DUF5703 domain-containing protein [Sedimentisphaerales bacterium]|nr:DUF5703 domain-containing protein [Sedimentisphaerales bacterium]